MTDNKSNYRSILKATSIFGGVQVFNILIGIIRVKFVAVLLGATGVGILGLFNAPLQLIMGITGLGIAFSAVRDISEAHGQGDQNKIAIAIKTLRKWSWFTGLLGALVTVFMAPLLSKWTFGNSDYSWAFIWLSVTLLLQAISKGQSAILQGMRKLKDMAKASVYGSLIGLMTAIPLYYYFGINGIVPSLIASAVTALLLSWYYSKKVELDPVELSTIDVWNYGKGMVKLGIVMTLTGLIGNLTSYILISFISQNGGVDQVGLYNSGWSIVGQYTGLVFMAMTTDYYPRLAAINQDNLKVKKLINQQAEMIMLILGPLLILFITTMPLLIRLFYTAAFLPVVIFANWTVLGILLKGMAWPIGFLFPAKGDLKTFGTIEVVALIFNLVTNMGFYYFFELEGLGVSFIINYMFGLFLTLFYANSKYGFSYEPNTLKIFLFSSIFLISGFFASYYLGQTSKYLIGFVIFLISLSYSLVSMNSRMDLVSDLRSILLRFRR